MHIVTLWPFCLGSGDQTWVLVLKHTSQAQPLSPQAICHFLYDLRQPHEPMSWVLICKLGISPFSNPALCVEAVRMHGAVWCLGNTL